MTSCCILTSQIEYATVNYAISDCIAVEDIQGEFRVYLLNTRDEYSVPLAGSFDDYTPVGWA